ncbi:MAG: GAF domain-containing protein [Epsilonproteobacteria bacterium]|nr:GAF domain-containing protein [Campylobacterota bacterium]
MDRYAFIAEFGKKLMVLENIDDSVELIAAQARKLVGAERCSIFIADKEDGILWTKVSDGIGRIVVSIDSGIVGDTYKSQKPQIVNAPYEDPRFLPVIDKKSGYVTKNMVTVPIFDSKREVIGVIQLLNKTRGEFDKSDLDILAFFANYVSGSLELVLLRES